MENRVYLARHGAIGGYLTVVAHELSPNGDFLRCDPTPQRLERPIPIRGRVSADDWRWRWWERDLEEHGTDQELAAIASAYDPDRHDPDWLSARRGSYPSD